jgi:hypothetical protein
MHILIAKNGPAGVCFVTSYLQSIVPHAYPHVHLYHPGTRRKKKGKRTKRYKQEGKSIRHFMNVLRPIPLFPSGLIVRKPRLQVIILTRRVLEHIRTLIQRAHTTHAFHKLRSH